MSKATRLGSFVLALAAASAAHAAVTITPQYSILSGIQDTSNLAGTGTRYRGSLSYDGVGGDLYVNAVNVLPGAGFDPLIDLHTEVGILTYNGGNTYALGTPITAAVDWFLEQPASRNGTIDAGVTPGIYNFSVEFVGGSSSAATDVLATWPLQIEVYPHLDATAGGTAIPAVIGYGDTTDVSVTLTNNMNRPLFTTSWYYSNGGMENGPYSLSGIFIGNWFDKEIPAGQSRTDDHTRWTADSSSLPPGNYVGLLGVIGGLYLGDEHSFLATSPRPTVELIPEPTSLGLVLMAGTLLTGARRRSA